ncbi:MAG TPA: TfpX/TfpZ family type IV pilin accessory protein [Dokdonella sp.]|nr:TfpX/TfpZ family type IV pilin accessory protein [Dokdonella sp.]
MSRWKAASIHLSISISVGLLVLALLFLVWYPQPYFDAAGGEHLVIVLLGVAIVLGPMLTLILFKSGKKGMLFDLCMIGFVQTAALVYGLYVIAQARPVFIAAAVDRFNVVMANEIDPIDLADGKKPEFRSLSFGGPRLVGVELPSDTKEKSDLLFSSLAGKDVQLYPKYYVDYALIASDLLTHARSLEKLRAANPENGRILDRWLEINRREDKDVAWMPISMRKSSLCMLIDAKTGEVLAPLPIYPW